MADERNPQLDVIETLNRPVIVQAGAGSGKTHTLTERIVAALTPDDDGKKAARSVENIVAITFTSKAAEELKSRLRSRLEEAGMHDQALLVDDANITTIHGFASRILRENALEFGIDANFEVISEAEDLQIFKDSLNSALTMMYSGADFLEDLMMNVSEHADEMFSELSEGGSSSFNEDDDEYKRLDPDILADETIFDIAEELRDQVESLISDLVQQQSSALFSEFIANELWSDGAVSSKLIYDSVRRLVKSFSTQPLLDEPHVFVGSYIEIGDIFKKALELLKETVTKINFNLEDEKELKASNGMIDSIEKIESFLKETHEGTHVSALLPRWLDLLDGIPKLSKKFRAKYDDYPYVEVYRIVLARLCLEFLLSVNRDSTMVFNRLAVLTFEAMEDEKDDFKFSNNDLLRVCFQKLSKLPEVAKAAQEKFDLIMVDEFQDTDSLQLEIIRLVSRGNFENVCTVGDVQQSIYRFRGADVNVFNNYKRKMLRNGSNVMVIPLHDNYRSHADVLALSDKIFENPHMFGKSYLTLNPKGKVNDVPDPMFDSIPRIQIQVMNHQTSGKQKFLTSDATVREAKKAAKHFKELKDAGARPSSMAVLLSKLTSGAGTPSPTEIAKIYQEALLEVGIESVISGGSTFSRSEEAQIVLNLLAIARNALDSDALVNLLESEIFNVSADTLLCLSSSFSADGNFEHKQNLSYGFLSMDDTQLTALNEADAEVLTFAHFQITNFMQNVAHEGIIPAIREFLSDCGVFDEFQGLGSEGLVRAGNYEKALAIIKEIHLKTTEIVEVHQQFAEFLENSKEAPGILSAIDSDYVEIMTVHASKGLQFDHVVVAELKDGKVKRQNTMVSNTPMEGIGQGTYYSAVKAIDRKKLREFVFDRDLLLGDCVKPDKSMSAGQLYAKMFATECEEELGEAKRLLYVAITRAVKSVLLQVRIGSVPKDDYAGCGIWGNLYETFQWDYACSKSTQFFELKNGSKGKLEFEFLPQALEFDAEEESEEVKITEPCAKFVKVQNSIEKLPVIHERDDKRETLSYSDLEKIACHKTLDVQVDSNENLDSDKATDFGSQVHSCLEKAIVSECFKISEIEDARLKSAVESVLATEEVKGIWKCDSVTPEMEFCVPVEIAGKTRFLRGQMDLVGITSDEACVIDYKTGKKPIDHILQAKVYAFALLCAEMKKVELHFVHAEIPDFVQSFEFTKDDVYDLKQAIEDVAVKL